MTTVVQVDCQRRQPGNITGENTGVVVYVVNCKTVPVGLFINVSATVSTVAVLSNDSEELVKGTFVGLANIAELRLEGFKTLRSLSRDVFRPLRSLERLLLVGFGAHRLSFAELGAALHGLSGTPLSRIVMHEIHSFRNEKTLDVSALLQMRNVSVRELSFSDNVITAISGRPSLILPDLRYLCVGSKARYYAAMNSLLDAWMLLSNINEITIYAYPVPDTLNPILSGGAVIIDKLDPAILWYLSPYLTFRNCYTQLQLPVARSLRRLTVRNFQLLDAVIDKPFCFARNNIEYLDLAGSPLPRPSMRLTGLDRVKHLNLQNTGMEELAGDFLRHFPLLEVLNLAQLPIGESISQIDSDFFGNHSKLAEIHLGDCRLTTIPPTAFERVPSLETLNLSSNSLRSFDVNLHNSGNLSHLNLSGNAISTLSDDLLAELNVIAQRRLENGEQLKVDLRGNQLSCLCNSTRFVRQLQDWVEKRKVDVSGFEELTCLYPNGSELAVSEVDVDESASQCSVLGQLKNGSDCPCDENLRRRLECVRLSLHGYFCRTSEGQLFSMTVRPLPSCPDFYRSATFVAPMVVGCVLALILVVSLIALYRHRKDERLHRILRRVSMRRIVRLGIQYLLARNRDDDPRNFRHDVFLYIQVYRYAAIV